MVDNFADYYATEEGYELVAKDYGFFSFSYDPETNNMFLAHVYVNPQGRKEGKTQELFRMIRLRAKSLGAKRVVGNIFRNHASLLGSASFFDC